ncbi:MAG: GGDEF domain-containing protein [Burkholderiales bacterium]|nr:GGDEF domain-containing protein [Burkholderiales bacterium]
MFEEEESIIRDISSALKNDGLDAPEARILLEKLLREYEKQLRASRQLIKISDRKAKELNSAKHKLQELSETLEYQATHDALTGILNKGAITEIAKEQLTQCDFVIVLFDIDHFKKVNDNYGHAVGDQVLSLIADLVEKNIKRKDQIGRFGGEEFIIILNDTAPRTCLEIAENLRRIIENAVLEVDDAEVKVTVSMGLTPCLKGEPFKNVYDRVDKLLYAAKRGGRNRVEASGV